MEIHKTEDVSVNFPQECIHVNLVSVRTQSDCDLDSDIHMTQLADDTRVLTKWTDGTGPVRPHDADHYDERQKNLHEEVTDSAETLHTDLELSQFPGLVSLLKQALPQCLDTEDYSTDPSAAQGHRPDVGTTHTHSADVGTTHTHGADVGTTQDPSTDVGTTHTHSADVGTTHTQSADISETEDCHTEAASFLTCVTSQAHTTDPPCLSDSDAGVPEPSAGMDMEVKTEGLHGSGASIGPTPSIEHSGVSSTSNTTFPENTATVDPPGSAGDRMENRVKEASDREGKTEHEGSDEQGTKVVHHNEDNEEERTGETKDNGEERTVETKDNGEERTVETKDNGEERTVETKDNGEERTVETKDNGEERTGETKDNGEERTVETKDNGEERTVETKDNGEERTVKTKDNGEERTVETKDNGEERTGETKDNGEERTVETKDNGEERTVETKDNGKERTVETKDNGEERTGETKDNGEERTVETKDNGEERTGETKDNGEKRTGTQDSSQEEKKAVHQTGDEEEKETEPSDNDEHEHETTQSDTEEVRLETLLALLDNADGHMPSIPEADSDADSDYIHSDHECPICMETSLRRLDTRSCCQFMMCIYCAKTYFETKVSEGIINIQCPNPDCQQQLSEYEIFSSISFDMRPKFLKFVTDARNDPTLKTCPRCDRTEQVDKKMLTMKSSVKKGLRVCCQTCDLEWCFRCHAPWHEGVTCKEHRKGDKEFRRWTKETKDRQVNAQKCPTCKVYIQRESGCPHMTCNLCSTDFCYNCGKYYFFTRSNHRLLINRVSHFLLGSHSSRLSPLGCPKNFLPEHNAARRLIRGSLLGLKVVGGVCALALAAGAAVVVVTAGPVVWCVRRARRRIRRRNRRS
ncbi:hypothetical protein ACOMHN_045165 [Nucella lapillus]